MNPLKNLKLTTLFACLAGFLLFHATSVTLAQAPPNCSVTEIQKLKAGDPQTGATFSSPLTVSEDYIVSTSFYCDGNRGAIYVFSRDPANPELWIQEQKISALDANSGDFLYGAYHGLNGDWIVGTSASEGGSLYLFHKTTGGWNQVHKIIPPGLPASSGLEGTCLGPDQIFARVAADESVRIISYSESTWSQDQVLTHPDGTTGTDFGFMCHVDSTGTRLAIGAPTDTAVFTNGGAVYIFQLEQGQWVYSFSILPQRVPGLISGPACAGKIHTYG